LKHNTVQTNQTNHPQITVHTSKRRQAGRVNINRAGRYRGSKRRLVGVTGPGSAGSKQRGTEGQAEGWSGASRDQSRRSQQRSDQAGSAKEQKQHAGQKQDTGPRTNTTPRQSLLVWP
ncbi:unnamed protein product, partial [Staurois parvus]